MEIRSKTIIYSKHKRKAVKEREIVVQEKLQKLDHIICNNVDLSKPTLDEYEDAKKELQAIYEKKGREAMFRSKARWVEEGEKPTKYFFNLEKKNYEKKKSILQLKIGENVTTSGIQEINKEIEKNYSELLETNLTKSQQINSKQEITEGLDIPKVPSSAQCGLELDLTLDELQSALKSFQKNKSPGEDGFSKEFHETFFDILANHLLDIYNEAFIKGQLSVSQRRGVITLIPKRGLLLDRIG